VGAKIHVNEVPPVESPNLSYFNLLIVQNLVSPYFSLFFKSKQTVRFANDLRIWECRKSKCLSVMGRIEIETLSRSDANRKADFYVVSLYEKL